MKLSCQDLGGKDCTYTVEGKSADEVKRKMWEHARRDHADVLAGMDEEKRKGMEARMDEVLANR
jgi:predicted small metal-binding protein